MYLGIDVGGTKIDAAYYDDVSVKHITRIATPGSYGEFLTELDGIFHQAGEAFQGIGIGVPGTVKDNQIIWVPNVHYLDKTNLTNDLQEKYNTKTFIANDAQLSLLGEAWQGAAFGREHAILISIGTGIGGAIMHDRKIIQGVNGGAGAFGWIHLDLNEPGASNHGYLERHASGTAVMELGSKLNPALTSHQVIENARKGNTECLQIVHGIAHKLGVSLAILASILEPEIIIISGGISEAFDLMEKKLEAAMKEFASAGMKQTPIVAGKLGVHAGVYGAVRLAMVGKKMFKD